MVNCCVPHCRIKKARGCGMAFHHFPMDNALIAKWVQAISHFGGKLDPDWIPTKSSVVCGRHFKEADYSTSTSRRILLPYSVPTVFAKISRNNLLEETQNGQEVEEGNYNELLSEKKSRSRKVWLDTQTIKEELGYSFINEVTEENLVNRGTETKLQHIPINQDTGCEYIKSEEYETEEKFEGMTYSEILCRLCASPSKDIISIFENGQSNFVLLEKIHTYLPIMMTAEDLLPTTVCGECINKLEICHSLVQGCLDADAVLKTMYGLQNSADVDCDANNQFEDTYNQTLEKNTVCEEYVNPDYYCMNNSEVLPEDMNEEHRSFQLDDQNGTRDNNTDNLYSTNTVDPHTKPEEESAVHKKLMLNKPTWKGRMKPKLKVVIVKMKNLNKITDKVELQKTVQLAINEKMKQQNVASNKEHKLPETPSVNNHCPDLGAESSTLKDREQDSGQNHDKIASDHTYTPKVCCQHCQQKFINKEELLLHQQTSKQCGNTYRCINCKSLFKSKSALYKHSEVCYNNVNPPEDKENLKNKMASIDTINNYETIVEKAKNEVTDSSSKNHNQGTVQKDVEVEVLDVDIKTNKKPGTFRLDRGCHIKFPKGFEHINTTHQAKILTAINKIIEMKIPKAETIVSERIKGPDGWKCKLCYETLPTARAYRLHRQTHTPRPFPCTHCNRMFTSERNLNQHLALHSNEKIYMCEFCGKVFKLRDSLKLHYFSHGKSEKIHKCNECGKTFASKYRYNQHRLRHGKATYLCDICGKSMKYPGSLRCHKSLHKQKILYECATCGKVYNSRQGLKTHTQIHLGNSSFACDKCGKSFETQLNLSEHKLTHTNAILYKCHICGKCFNFRLQLKKHIARHQITLKYRCKLCQITFTNMKELLIHRRNHSSVDTVNYQGEEQTLMEIIS